MLDVVLITFLNQPRATVVLIKQQVLVNWLSIRLNATNRLGFLSVLVCSQVDRTRVHHGAWKKMSQLSAEGCRHHLIGRCERRGHEQRCGFWCWGNNIRGVNEKAWS